MARKGDSHLADMIGLQDYGHKSAGWAIAIDAKDTGNEKH
jgi:hypothetical protein